ncbi:hypothetical protein JI666_09755 [Bacillus sp. NTK071]|uniref:hypothetical protein n=1 Tax=Bacillus sp. NTK071 TaxID=2802175 RepID=UPI001A8FB62C|nr:hypothetical protein [Bacillus sp. NTK071]MBN8209029.1 hypothetical protein [Bacillus sp. NTK071]
MVVPADATITGLVVSIRDEILTTQNVTAEIYRSTNCGFASIATGIIATVTGPNNQNSPNCCAVATAKFPVKQCDLLSVRITHSGNQSLQDGATAAILFST